MREIELLTEADLRRAPWRNGRGFTDELALWPAAASFERGDFDVRISRASVVEAGPFSSFAGFDRILVVVAGQALELQHGEHASRAWLRPLEPYGFSGDWSTHAELPRGPIDDFNVVTRRGIVRADVQPLRLGRRSARATLDCTDALLHVLAGEVVARVTGEEEPFELSARESVRIDGAAPNDEIEVVGASEDACALLVRLTRVFERR